MNEVTSPDTAPDLPKFASKGNGTTLQGLHAFLHTLRKNGVRRFHGTLDGDYTEIEFHAFEPPEGIKLDFRAQGVDEIAKALERAPMAGLCACGHDLLEHNESGQCLFACPTATCAREVKKPPTQE